MGTRSFRPLVAPFVVGITTRLFGIINNHNKKQILFRLTMASSLSPIRSSPELEELKKSIYDHKDYVSLLSIVCRWPHSHWQGGTLGTQFVVLRVHETHTEATGEWKWLLGSTESTCSTGILSAVGWRLLKGRLSRRVSITSTILLVVALSLG